MLKIEDLKVGDVLLKEYAGDYLLLPTQETKILAICGELIFLSIWGAHNKAGSPITIHQLNENGYKLKPEHPEFKVDQPLMVRNGEVWSHRRYFAFFREGKVYCWNGGLTGWTSRGAVSKWEHYRLPTEEELNS